MENLPIEIKFPLKKKMKILCGVLQLDEIKMLI